MTEIQEDLQRFEQWMENNKLVLNLTKTKCMLFGTKQKLANAFFKIQLHGSDCQLYTYYVRIISHHYVRH